MLLPASRDRCDASLHETGYGVGSRRLTGWLLFHVLEFSKGPLFAICIVFTLGTVDISRLNFGVLPLISKVKGGDNIRQFRPIALIKVPFKIGTKAYASHLSPVAHRVINRCQSAFIKGRYILEGSGALEEIMHKVK